MVVYYILYVSLTIIYLFLDDDQKKYLFIYNLNLNDYYIFFLIPMFSFNKEILTRWLNIAKKTVKPILQFCSDFLRPPLWLDFLPFNWPYQALPS